MRLLRESHLFKLGECAGTGQGCVGQQVAAMGEVEDMQSRHVDLDLPAGAKPIISETCSGALRRALSSSTVPTASSGTSRVHVAGRGRHMQEGTCLRQLPQGSVPAALRMLSACAC